MGGDRRPRPQSQSQPQSPGLAANGKKRVLFVCVGNSCRSQMAEGFARAYGSDVMEAASAGVSPATVIAPLTHQVLGEKNIRIDEHFPKGFGMVAHEQFDIVVNMSGAPLAVQGAQIVDWPVVDPIGQKMDVYRSVASQIEALVMGLILQLRTAPK